MNSLTNCLIQCATMYVDKKGDTCIVTIVFTIYRLDIMMFHSLAAVFTTYGNIATVVQKNADASSNGQNPALTPS